MKLTQKIIAVICAIAVYSTAYAADSVFTPPTENPDPGQGYVIATGEHQMYCKGGSKDDFGCDFDISTTRCPAAFTPKVMFSVRTNNYSGVCGMRGYNLDAPAPQVNNTNGYWVHFDNAYANFVSCDDRNVTVVYTTMCVRN